MNALWSKDFSLGSPPGGRTCFCVWTEGGGDSSQEPPRENQVLVLCPCLIGVKSNPTVTTWVPWSRSRSPSLSNRGGVGWGGGELGGAVSGCRSPPVQSIVQCGASENSIAVQSFLHHQVQCKQLFERQDKEVNRLFGTSQRVNGCIKVLIRLPTDRLPHWAHSEQRRRLPIKQFYFCPSL